MASNAPSLGARIRNARERKKITQPQLAKVLDVSVRAVSDWERGRTRPRNRLGALEEVLGVDLTNGQKPPAVTTPDEAAIWSMDRFSEDERRALIRALRDTRGQTSIAQ